MTSHFLSETMQTWGQWSNIFKVLEDNKLSNSNSTLGQNELSKMKAKKGFFWLNIRRIHQHQTHSVRNIKVLQAEKKMILEGNMYLCKGMQSTRHGNVVTIWVNL